VSAIERRAFQAGSSTPRRGIDSLVGAALLAAAVLVHAQTAPEGPAPAAPSIDALPKPLAQPPLDLEALARGYAATTESHTVFPGPQRQAGLIIFISLSVPLPTLERLLDQAAGAGASVVLRGFADGSLRQTVTQLQALIGARPIAVQVDPPAFDRFDITRVPSFVLLRDGARPRPCAAGSCAPPEDYLQVAGDVSLDYALAHMRRAAPGFQAEIDLFLGRLQP
jgi:conjugal transfer pilus assembly protein TrbC